MTPQVRESETTHIAGPRIHTETGPLNALQIVHPDLVIIAPASDGRATPALSMVEKRRRRQARMRNRG